MAKFIIKDKVYDTTKMNFVGKVKKRYEFTTYFLQQMFGKGIGREYDCDLYRSDKGNWLLVHDDISGCIGEAITEKEAKSLLKHNNYDAYAREYGELEEA